MNNDDNTQTHHILTKGTAVSHYVIISKIGAGGMGEVYLADDKTLNRKVALKFLSSYLSSDTTARERFTREAQAAAKLNHSNIVTIHEVGEFGNRPFIAMENIDGRSLQDHLSEHDDSIDSVLSLAIGIAKGLGEAHKAQIVHRDIKPSNILVDKDGLAKILDFGLATVEGSSKLTKTGSTLGTVGYMSPEQINGDNIDERSDLFSFGVLLYELITGKCPFKRKNETATIKAVLNETPEPLARYKSDVPDELQRIVSNLLEKDLDMRYQTVSGVLSDLKKLKKDLGLGHSGETQQIVLEKPSIAVLPFTNLSTEKEQEYFCDGMAEEIINALTKVEELYVVARTSAFAFKGKNEDIREIGNKLNVKTVLEGSVRKSGNRLRITTQLINVADGYHLWSERYDRQMEDVFAVQDEISLKIVEQMKIKLLRKDKAKIIKRYTEDTIAYNLYSKGRFFWNKRTEVGLLKGIDYLRQAIAQDPDYALAYAGIAECYSLLCSYQILSPADTIPNIDSASKKALELDANLAEGYEARAHSHMLSSWNWKSAFKDFERATELNPAYAIAYLRHACVLTAVGELEEALVFTKKAQHHDPLSLITHLGPALDYYIQGKQGEAIMASKVVIEMDATFPVSHLILALTYEQLDMYNQAIKEFELAIEYSGNSLMLKAALAHVLAISGKTDEAKVILDELLQLSEEKYVSPYSFASIYVGLGENDTAFEWLEKVVSDKSVWLIHLHIGSDRRFDRVRHDPRFKKLLKDINIES